MNDVIEGNGIRNFLSDGLGVIMVVDLVDYPGENDIIIRNNDLVIAERHKSSKRSFRQRRIPMVDENIKINIGSLSIEFTDEEHAKEFRGCGFILGE